MSGRMAKRGLLEGAERRLQPNQRRETLVLEGALDGTETVRAFRMARRREVEQAGWVGDQQGRQGQLSDRRGIPQ